MRVAVILALLLPASAVARPSVAVVGIHGGTGHDDAELRRIGEDLVAGFKTADTFEVLGADALAERFDAERGRLAEHIWLTPARQAFEEGRVLYDNAQPDRAIDAFHRASALLDSAAAHLQDARLPVDVQLYLGLSHAAMNRLDDARESFTGVVRLAPSRVLDENEFPPRVVEMFEDVKREALSRPLATVRVEGAVGRIWLDGRFAGQSPGDLSGVMPGFHVLVVDGADRGRAVAELNLAPGASEVVRPRLERPTLARDPEDPWESARSPFSRRLYEEIGRVAGTDLVAIAAFDSDGNLRIALWSTRASHASAAVVASLGASPGERSAFVRQLAERVSMYVLPDGTVKPDRVVADLVPLRPGRNPELVDLIFGTPAAAPPAPTPASPTQSVRKAPHPAGAVVAILAGGIGAAIAGTVIGVATRPTTATGGTVNIRFP